MLGGGECYIEVLGAALTDPDSGTRKNPFLDKFLCISEKCGLEQFCRARALLQNALFGFCRNKIFFFDFDDFPFSLQYPTFVGGVKSRCVKSRFHCILTLF